MYLVLYKKMPPGAFLAITRDHSIGEVPGSVEMVPISLPELPKPSRTPGKSQKSIFKNQIFYIKHKKHKI